MTTFARLGLMTFGLVLLSLAVFWTSALTPLLNESVQDSFIGFLLPMTDNATFDERLLVLWFAIAATFEAGICLRIAALPSSRRQH
ncbi:MAG: hypothetical protein WC052_03640 [Patescibacteria group bacterium]|jgi:hypothetical protein